MFTGIAGVIAFLVGLALIVVIGQRINCNLGIVALAGAFIIGIFNGVAPGTVVSLFPVNIFFIQFSTTLFFGFIISTGVFNKLVNRIMVKVKNPRLAPYLIWICIVIVQLLGAGTGAGPVVVSPLAFSIAAAIGMSPVLTVVAVYTGSIFSGSFPWVDAGVLYKSMMATVLGDAGAESALMGVAITHAIIGLVLLTIHYVIYKGFAMSTDINFADDEPFTSEQKRALTLVGIFIFLVVVPNLINTIVPNAICAFFSKYFVVNSLCLIGSVACVALHIGESPVDVVKNRVPWNVILMVFGMCTYVNLASYFDVIDVVGGIISNSVPVFFIPLAIAAVGAALSFVASGIVVWPMLIALVPGICEATGCNPVPLCIAAIVSCGVTGLSPISQGGALAAIGASEEIRQEIFGPQFRAAFIGLALLIVFSAVGGFQFLGGLS